MLADTALPIKIPNPEFQISDRFRRGMNRPEEKTMEATAKSDMKVHDKLYINGQWVKSTGPNTIDVINSTTEEVMGRIPEGTPEDVNAAVAAAKAAFEKWSTTSIEERARFLQLISDKLNARKEEIAGVIADEVGM